MVEPVEPYLRHYAAQAGLRAIANYSGYNTSFQEAAGGSPDLLNEATDAVFGVAQTGESVPRSRP